MQEPELDITSEENEPNQVKHLPPIDDNAPDWSALMINPSGPSVVASLRMEVDRIAPVLDRAMESAKTYKPYWTSYSPHDVLALDMQFVQLTISLQDRRATGEETKLASRVWQSMEGKLRHKATRLNHLAWKTLHDDPWSWPYSARLLEEHGFMAEANAVRAFLFGYACLVANIDQHLLDVEHEGLRDLYKRLYGEQTQMPDLPPGMAVAESLQPPAEIKPDPDMPVQMIFDNALYALAKYNLDLLAPKIEQHIVQEYPDIRYKLGYSYILQDLLQIYIAVVGLDGKLTMGESAVWQVLNQLAHENRLGNLESLLQEAQAQQAFRSLSAIVQYDIVEGTNFTQTLRTFLIEFARIVAHKDGLSTIEEQENSRLESEIDNTIAQIRQTSTQPLFSECTSEDAQHPQRSERELCRRRPSRSQ